MRALDVGTPDNQGKVYFRRHAKVADFEAKDRKDTQYRSIRRTRIECWGQWKSNRLEEPIHKTILSGLGLLAMTMSKSTCHASDIPIRPAHAARRAAGRTDARPQSLQTRFETIFVDMPAHDQDYNDSVEDYVIVRLAAAMVTALIEPSYMRL
jgi:hypothetical protein